MLKTITHIALGTALLPGIAMAQDARPDDDVKPAFTTGVAKGRDLLDTAISASIITSGDLQKIGTRSLADIIGTIPGIRAESAGTDGIVALTIRGLPLAGDGAKYVQIQEDGLPVFEFGDIGYATPTAFLRSDITTAQVQAIRGGSASTFVSNAPGGVVNFISRTGEMSGGVVEMSSGLNYGLGRIDFDYGEKIDDHWRFNVGGFYHLGEGPRATGYDAFSGGQIKANLTRSFDNGYIRFYAKLMDDREPSYGSVPVQIGGTGANPQVTPIAGLDPNNNPVNIDLHQGNRSKVRSFGIEAQFDLAGWSVTDHFRYAQNSGVHNAVQTYAEGLAGYAPTYYGGPGATLTYADGALSGQAVANPATLNGNGDAVGLLLAHADLNSLNNTTNDLRIGRSFALGKGKLSTSAGIYASSQDIDMLWSFSTVLSSVAGGGNATLLNVTNAQGVPIVAQGTVGYSAQMPGAVLTQFQHRDYQTNYRVLAPYGSINYQLGKLSIGASLRYDKGKAQGTTYGWELFDNAMSLTSVDFSRNGTITTPETLTASLPLNEPGSVNYNYAYYSYSIGANYRFADDFSAFARISRGGRAGADKLPFSPTFDPAGGAVIDPADAFRHIKQAEGGVKFRKGGVTVFITAFWAQTSESNDQLGTDDQGNLIDVSIDRIYSAKGVELESELRKGPFSLHLGATYTKSKIDEDSNDPTENGKIPRHSPNLFFNAMPQFETRHLAIGTTISGVTGSYAQDNDGLKQPGYVLVNPFVQWRPVKRLTATINVYNMFNRLAIVSLDSNGVPVNGLAAAQVLNGRTATGSIRVAF